MASIVAVFLAEEFILRICKCLSELKLWKCLSSVYTQWKRRAWVNFLLDIKIRSNISHTNESVLSLYVLSTCLWYALAVLSVVRGRKMTCNEQLDITIKEAYLLAFILDWMENSCGRVFKFENKCGDNHRGNRSHESLRTVTTLERELKS